MKIIKKNQALINVNFLLFLLMFVLSSCREEAGNNKFETSEDAKEFYEFVKELNVNFPSVNSIQRSKKLNENEKEIFISARKIIEEASRGNLTKNRYTCINSKLYATLGIIIGIRFKIIPCPSPGEPPSCSTTCTCNLIRCLSAVSIEDCKCIRNSWQCFNRCRAEEFDVFVEE